MNDNNRPVSFLKKAIKYLVGASILLLLIIGSGLWFYYHYYENDEFFASDETNTLEQVMEDGRVLQERIVKQEQVIAQLSENQQTLQAAIKKLSRSLGRDRSDWMLAETEQLLIIANHRLQLARDIDSALAALNTADNQLKKLANPNLLSVRKAIAKEISQLKTLERIDIPGTTLRLANISEQIGTIPLAVNIIDNKHQETDTGGTEQSSSPGLFGQIWQDITNSIRIRTDNQQHKMLLPPDKEYFLRENLRLKLYSTQNALLAGQYKTYSNYLDDCTRWITKYFDTSNKAVKNILDQLSAMRKSSSNTRMPDISGSLTLLRKNLANRDST